MNAKTKIKHTEGPWQTKAEEAGVGYIRVRGTRLGGRYKVANVICPTSDDRDKEETRANARLIAAAPALLDALRNLVAAVENLDADSLHELLAAYAAIKSATHAGETK